MDGSTKPSCCTCDRMHHLMGPQTEGSSGATPGTTPFVNRAASQSEGESANCIPNAERLPASHGILDDARGRVGKQPPLGRTTCTCDTFRLVAGEPRRRSNQQIADGFATLEGVALNLRTEKRGDRRQADVIRKVFPIIWLYPPNRAVARRSRDRCENE